MPWGWFTAGILYAVGALLAWVSVPEDDPKDVWCAIWCATWPVTGIAAVLIRPGSDGS